MLGPSHIHIEHDHDGWSTVLRGQDFNPVLIFIGIVHFGMGASFAIGGISSMVAALATFSAAGTFGALFAIPFALIGSVFAAWPPFVAYRMLHQTHLEASGGALRVRRTVAGFTLGETILDLTDSAPHHDGSNLHLGELKVPVATAPNLNKVIELLREGAQMGPNVVPPAPPQLERLR